MTVRAKEFEADNITFENSSTPRKIVGQAVALGVDSDRAIFRNCRFLANQDTLYANSGRQYYYKCLLRGDVDFIFGNASAVFDHCEIQSTGKGYLTAQSRTSDDRKPDMFWRTASSPPPMACRTARSISVGPGGHTRGWFTSNATWAHRLTPPVG